MQRGGLMELALGQCPTFLQGEKKYWLLGHDVYCTSLPNKLKQVIVLNQLPPDPLPSCNRRGKGILRNSAKKIGFSSDQSHEMLLPSLVLDLTVSFYKVEYVTPLDPVCWRLFKKFPSTCYGVWTLYFQLRKVNPQQEKLIVLPRSSLLFEYLSRRFCLESFYGKSGEKSGKWKEKSGKWKKKKILLML